MQPVRLKPVMLRPRLRRIWSLKALRRRRRPCAIRPMHFAHLQHIHVETNLLRYIEMHQESKVPEHQESSTKNAEEKSSAATIAEVGFLISLPVCSACPTCLRCKAECVTEAPKEGKKECETHDPLEAPTGPGRPRHAGEEPHTSYNSYKHKQVRRRPQRSACAETAQWQPVRRGKAGPRHSEPCEPEESPEPEQKEQKGWQQAQPAQPAQPARQAQPAQQEQPEQQAQQAQSWKRPGKMSMRSSGAKSKNGSSTAPSTGLRWRPTVPHSDR